jgi:hypothetical protein
VRLVRRNRGEWREVGRWVEWRWLVREGLSVGLGRVAICTSADPWFDRSRHGGAVLEGCDVCTKIYESESVSVSTGSSVSSMISSLIR